VGRIMWDDDQFGFLLIQGKQIFNNESMGLEIRGMTLVIRTLKAISAGVYECEGRNEIGKGLSNPLELRVKCKFF